MPFLGVVNGRVLSCAIPKNSTRPLSTARVPPPHRDRSGQAWRACCSGFPLARECAEYALAKLPRTHRHAVPRARRHPVAATTDRSRILSRYPFVSADRPAPSRMPHSTPCGGGSDSDRAVVAPGAAKRVFSATMNSSGSDQTFSRRAGKLPSHIERLPHARRRTSRPGRDIRVAARA